MLYLRSILASAVVWLIANPAVLYSLVAYLAANLSNAMLDVRARDAGWSAPLRRLLDRVAFVSQRGAENRWSLPFYGVSVLREVVEHISTPPPPPVPASGDTIAPPPPDDSEAPSSPKGFAELGVLALVGALMSLVVLASSTCRMPDPDGCVPNETRCHEGQPWVCSGTRRWTPQPPAGPCSARDPLAPAAVCCRAPTPYGTSIHTCVVSSEACISESDGGAPSAGEGGGK